MLRILAFNKNAQKSMLVASGINIIMVLAKEFVTYDLPHLVRIKRIFFNHKKNFAGSILTD